MDGWLALAVTDVAVSLSQQAIAVGFFLVMLTPYVSVACLAFHCYRSASIDAAHRKKKLHVHSPFAAYGEVPASMLFWN